MVFNLNINTDWLEDLQKQYWWDVVKWYLNTAIKKATLVLEWEAKRESPVDRGQLRSNFLTKHYDLKSVLYNPTKYAEFVQFGTRPHTPPREPIKQYAERKWIPAFALWYSIKRRGTKANDFLGRAVRQSETKIDRILWNTLNTLINKLNK